MRSGNGRHRRPRQAPALLVTVGVTSAGLALPLLGATGAQAASADTWDSVAECESGGMWSANDGNGYYGGLQLTMGTWEEYGGTDYAERPDLASRGQQIAVAEEIFAEEGPEAWPRCSVNAGLTLEDTEKPDEGGLLSPVPERPYDGGDGDGSGSSGGLGGLLPLPSLTPGDADEKADEKADDGADKNADKNEEKAGEKDSDAAAPTESAAPSETPGAGTGTGTGGKHRGAPADSERGDEPTRGEHRRDSGTRTDKGTDKGADERTAPGTGAGGDTGTAPDKGSDKGTDKADRYTVRTGDSLSAIAAEHDVRGGWPALYEANRDLVGADPDLIHPGQKLSL